MSNILVYNIENYLYNTFNIYKNCIYVTIGFGRVRYINNNRFGIKLCRDYKIDL